MKMRTPIVAVSFVVALVTVLANEANALTTLEYGGRDPLVGSWYIHVHQNASKGCVPAQDFVSIENENSDHTLAATDNASPPSQETASLGVWEKVGNGTYVENQYQLTSDASGNPTGLFFVHAFTTLDPGGNSFHGSPYTFRIFDQNGHFICGGSGTANGFRLSI